MTYFTKNCTRCCDLELKEYGFKRKKGVYVRVVNDVVQCLEIEKLRSGRECRGMFSVLPLCMRLSEEYIFGVVYPRELRQFETALGPQMLHSWELDPKSEESVKDCVAEIVRHIRSYLIPFFERANCCETGLAEIVAVDKLFNENRISCLQMNGMEDFSTPDAGLNLLDRAKYYMALKNGDYALAFECQSALLNQNLIAHEKRRHYDFLPAETLERDRLEIQRLQAELKRIEARDTEYFQRMIDENEAYSRETLQKIL